jgi:hypothetical protein
MFRFRRRVHRDFFSRSDTGRLRYARRIGGHHADCLFSVYCFLGHTYLSVKQMGIRAAVTPDFQSSSLAHQRNLRSKALDLANNQTTA